MIYILIFLLLMPCTASAWDTTDIVLESTWQVLHIIDWQQTLSIARNPNEWYELNPILGKHPSVGNVNTYMFCSAIGHGIVSHYIPKLLGKQSRNIWQATSILITFSAVANNYSIGIRFAL